MKTRGANGRPEVRGRHSGGGGIINGETDKGRVKGGWQDKKWRVAAVRLR